MNGKAGRFRTKRSIPSRVPIVTVVMVMMAVALLSPAVVDMVGAAPVTTTESISARTNSQVDTCENIGRGRASVSYSYENGKLVGSQVTCTGGDLDGQVCVNTKTTQDCYKPKARQSPLPAIGSIPDTIHPVERDVEADSPTGQPTAGVAEDPADLDPADLIEVVPNEPVTRLEDAAIQPGERPTVEDPSGSETVVIANQSGSTVTDNAIAQINACRGLGGKETVVHDRNTADGLKWVDVMCKGGLLHGMWCINYPGFTYCIPPYFRQPEEGIRVTPTGGIEAVSEPAPATTTASEEAAEPTVVATAPATEKPVVEPTAAPTEAPAEPTIAPTEESLEPTEVPSEEPVLPDSPIEDDTVPPGEAEDPTQAEPTPTEVILQ